MSFGYYGFSPYVPVAVKTEKARKTVQKLRKQGFTVNPIEAFNGAIAQTFWGKSWCTNLESYADYENRVPRGRSYLRNGFVCHLAIEPGRVLANVQGSSLYSVDIKIKPLDKKRWEKTCELCAGQIGSLVELLQGKFSKEVMRIVCDHDTGIFPSPKEISFTCSCPDYASMCKHVAAVLYGIGRRLDEDPALLFTLRCVDPNDLMPASIETMVEEETDDSLDPNSLGALFHIELDTTGEEPQTPSVKSTKAEKNAESAKANKKKAAESVPLKKAEQPKKDSLKRKTKEEKATDPVSGKKSEKHSASSPSQKQLLSPEQRALELQTSSAKSKNAEKKTGSITAKKEKATESVPLQKAEQPKNDSLPNDTKTEKVIGPVAGKKNEESIARPPSPQEDQRKTMPKGLLKRNRPTGTAIRNLQKLAGQDDETFAKNVGIALSTVVRWKKTRGVLRLRSDSLDLLLAFQEQLLRTLV